MLLFCDLETTGLSPEYDLIIEVGFMITTDYLEVVDKTSAVIHMGGMDYIADGEGGPYWEPPFGVHKIVTEMHNKNNLWNESNSSNFTPLNVENSMVRWLQDHKAEGLPLVGSTIGFDREFLRIQMPRLHGLFDYHSVDVSSIKFMGNLWAPIAEHDWPLNEKKHRVLPDMMDTLRELNLFRTAYFEH